MKPLFGQIAVEEGYLHPEEIEKCAEIQRASLNYKPIGQIAVELGYITSEIVEKCITLQQSTHREKSFGQIAIENGFMKSHEAEDCAKVQLKSLGATISLEQAAAVLQDLGLLFTKQFTGAFNPVAERLLFENPSAVERLDLDYISVQFRQRSNHHIPLQTRHVAGVPLEVLNELA